MPYFSLFTETSHVKDECSVLICNQCSNPFSCSLRLESYLFKLNHRFLWGLSIHILTNATIIHGKWGYDKNGDCSEIHGIFLKLVVIDDHMINESGKWLFWCHMKKKYFWFPVNALPQNISKCVSGCIIVINRWFGDLKPLS